MKRRKLDTVSECADVCKGIKTLLSDMMKAKCESGSNAPVGISSLNAKGIALLLDLKTASRKIDDELETQNAELQEYSTRLEELNTKLSLVTYEKELHQQEVVECTSFKSISAESLDLLPLESFLALNEKASVHNEHQLLVERLNFELIHRKRLTAKAEALKEKRKRAAEAKAVAAKQLLATETKFKSLHKTSTPFNQYIPLLPSKFFRGTQKSQCLPPPLYLLYNQAGTFREFFDKDVEVEVLGDIQQAISYEQVKNPGIGTAELCIPHPLQVLICISTTTAKFAIEFYYYPHLKFVTAWTSSGDIVLPYLFPRDSGDTIPSATLHMLGESEGTNISNFTHLLKGRPYMWAQCVCGLTKLDTIPPWGASNEGVNVQTTQQDLAGQSLSLVIKQIKKR